MRDNVIYVLGAIALHSVVYGPIIATVHVTKAKKKKKCELSHRRRFKRNNDRSKCINAKFPRNKYIRTHINTNCPYHCRKITKHIIKSQNFNFHLSLHFKSQRQQNPLLHILRIMPHSFETSHKVMHKKWGDVFWCVGMSSGSLHCVVNCLHNGDSPRFSLTSKNIYPRTFCTV